MGGQKHAFTRRDALKWGLFAGAATLLPLERIVQAGSSLNRMAESLHPRPFSLPFSTPPVIQPIRSDDTTDYYEVRQIETPVEIIPGFTTMAWGYNGLVPGPTFDVRQGRQTSVRQINSLPTTHPHEGYDVWTSTHLHGSSSLPQYDGYASDITPPGYFKDYVYPNTQNARTMWYHDHGVHHTGNNVFMGLAGMYRLLDQRDIDLDLPRGDYDVPLIVGDAMFDGNGALLFDDRLHAGAMGDVILVNGVPWPAMKVERRKYRFRILVAATGRSFQFTLDSGEPMVVIGTDGGLLPVPQPVKRLRQGMAERYDVVIDFSKYPIGRRVVLRNLSNKNNVRYTNTDKVMAFDVVADPSTTAFNSVPDALYPDNPIMTLQPSEATATRQIRLHRTGGEWVINRTTWSEVISSGYQKTVANPALNAVEIWEITNNSGGWFHPLHIHLIDFKILDRNGAPPLPQERGPKDTVYIGENETVRVLARFGPHPGKYMIHCHNLAHEDHDMMAQFQVGDGGDDPITAAPPQPEV